MDLGTVILAPVAVISSSKSEEELDRIADFQTTRAIDSLRSIGGERVVVDDVVEGSFSVREGTEFLSFQCTTIQLVVFYVKGVRAGHT